MEQIGRYKILGEIGRGAMGIVYRAQDPAIGRIVAIKTIRLGDLADPSEVAKLRDRLRREAQSAGILSHPGIVTIYDVAEQDDLAYISMEYVDGPTLERMMLTDPPDGKLILEILTQTAAALDYAHKRGIVHRDIKPANIMIHERSIAKVTDFGVARIQSQQMTQAGSLVGTPNYMSPEQIHGRPVDGRSDQFSLAVIAYELLTGERPFTADSIPALALKITQEDPPQAHQINRTLTWPVDTVLRRALSKKPEDRYPTCSDFIFAVENAFRSSKGWKPAPPGAFQNQPTIAAAPPTPALQPAPARPMPDVIISTPPQTPRFLVWARSLALMVLGAGVVFVSTIGALRWFDQEEPTRPGVRDETAAAKEEPPPPPVRKPSPMPAEPAEERSQERPEEPLPRRTERVKTGATPEPVRFATNPPGARLEIDGKPELACTAPCTLDLPGGRHTLAATLDGYRRTLKIFETPAESELFLNLDHTSGTLVVRSEVPGAAIFVDGQIRREKTPAMFSLPTGKHSIEVVQDNQRKTQEVTIRESMTTNLAISLEEP